jgi:hypothetical protein
LSIETHPYPPGDSVVAFDNNQVLHRRWKLANEVHCNVVTVVVHFELRKTSNMQSSTPLPADWMYRELTDTEKQFVKYIDFDNDVKEIHYKHLYKMLLLQNNEWLMMPIMIK